MTMQTATPISVYSTRQRAGTHADSLIRKAQKGLRLSDGQDAAWTCRGAHFIGALFLFFRMRSVCDLEHEHRDVV